MREAPLFGPGATARKASPIFGTGIADAGLAASWGDIPPVRERARVSIRGPECALSLGRERNQRRRVRSRRSSQELPLLLG